MPKLLREYVQQILKEMSPEEIQSVCPGLKSTDRMDAIATAMIAHSTQTRRTGEPYHTHPIAVAQIISRYYGSDKNACLVGLFHDTFEDAPRKGTATEHELSDWIKFAEDKSIDKEKIINAVRALTHAPGTDYTGYLLNLAGDPSHPLPLRVKLADMLHNVTSGGLKRSSWEKYTSAINSLEEKSGGVPNGITGEHWQSLKNALIDSEPPQEVP
jgi:(p)ppGpp synthase/HD superfamily hydrolase